MKKPLKDVSGTTMALTSLAVFAAAAVVSTPMWLYYRRKRKKIDHLANTAPESAAKAEPQSESDEPPSSESGQ